MIQLIVTDLDGTLLNDKKELPANFWEFEKKLRDLGIVFAVASGRPYESMKKVFKKNLNHILFIAENGGLIKYREREIKTSAMQPSDINELIDLSRKLDNTHILLCGKEVMWHESKDLDFIQESSKYYEHMIHVDDLQKLNEPVIKFTLCDMINAESNSAENLAHLSDKFTMAVSGLRWLDITNKSVNKGTAIEFMQELWNIPKEHTLAFGDYFNDKEMLIQAGQSFAMKNAHPKIKEVAKGITEFDNEENGVLKEIIKLLKL